jgi:hypothetical protein
MIDIIGWILTIGGGIFYVLTLGFLIVHQPALPVNQGLPLGVLSPWPFFIGLVILTRRSLYY